MTGSVRLFRLAITMRASDGVISGLRLTWHQVTPHHTEPLSSFQTNCCRKQLILVRGRTKLVGVKGVAKGRFLAPAACVTVGPSTTLSRPPFGRSACCLCRALLHTRKRGVSGHDVHTYIRAVSPSCKQTTRLPDEGAPKGLATPSKPKTETHDHDAGKRKTERYLPCCGAIQYLKKKKSARRGAP